MTRSCWAFSIVLFTVTSPVLAFHGTPRGLVAPGDDDGPYPAAATQANLLQASVRTASSRHCIWGPEGDSWHSSRASAIWTVALNETGLDAQGVSVFACNMPKVPWSWVERVRAMDHTKFHTYNFQGAQWWAMKLQEQGNWWPQFQARNWVMNFAEANFSAGDVLKITDIEEGYKPIGDFDKSDMKSYDSRNAATKAQNWESGDLQSYLQYFDDSYFQVMAASNFTLCPGGDRPWSMRFYEAIMSGSIPILGSEEFDLSAPDLWPLLRVPYKFYLLDSPEPFVYKKEWAEENMRLFIKYQTFHEGDNVIPKSEGTAAPA